MSASVSPVAAPVVVEGELRSQPLYHSCGSGSFSGIAYSVPGVSQRSAHAARTVSGAIGFPAVLLLQRGRAQVPALVPLPWQWQLLRHPTLSAHDQPALYTNVQASQAPQSALLVRPHKNLSQDSSRGCNWVSFQKYNSCTRSASGGLIAMYRASCSQKRPEIRLLKGFMKQSHLGGTSWAHPS